MTYPFRDGRAFGKARRGTTRPPVTSVTMSTIGSPIDVGGTRQASVSIQVASGDLVDRGVEWSSDVPGVATVSSTGLVTGVAQGVATISVSCEGKTDSEAITVQVDVDLVVASVVVSGGATVAEGGTVQFGAVAYNATGTQLTGKTFTWASSNAAIASVDANGLVTGEAAGGPVTITATCETVDGTDTITVQAAGSVVPFFWDDFESGNLTKSMNGFSWGSATAVGVRPEHKRGGTYSLRFRWPANVDSPVSEMRFNLGAYYPELWIEYYIYFPEGGEPNPHPALPPGSTMNRYVQRVPPTGSSNNKFLRLWPNIYTDVRGKVGVQTWSIATPAGDNRFQFDTSAYPDVGTGPIGGSLNPFVSDTVNAVRGQWVQVRIHYLQSTGAGAFDGVFNLWLDGVAKLTTALNAYNDEFPAGVRYGYLMGAANADFVADTYVWIDDIAFYNQDPGW